MRAIRITVARDFNIGVVACMRHTFRKVRLILHLALEGFADVMGRWAGRTESSCAYRPLMVFRDDYMDGLAI